MIKKILLVLTVFVFVFSSVGISLALEKGNKRKGKYTYRKVYKACHARGEVDAPKPTLNPDAKTQAQWERLFDKKDFKDFGCQQEWKAHAYSRPLPAKLCIIGISARSLFFRYLSFYRRKRDAIPARPAALSVPRFALALPVDG